MMRPPPNIKSDSNKDICVKRFKELWPNVDDLRSCIKQVLPSDDDNLLDIIEDFGENKISNIDKLAELLYNIIGPNFLHTIYGDDEHHKKTKEFRETIILTCIKLGEFEEDDIIQAARKDSSTRFEPSSIADVGKMAVFRKWKNGILRWLRFPSETTESPPGEDNPVPSEIVVALKELKPLHDYQFTTGLEIKNMLQIEEHQKRLLIQIPTGAGKTRLVVDTLIDWLNIGKESSPPQQKNSRYILWIAQSRELCEQAISEFKEVYEQKGDSAITIHRLYAGLQNLQTVIDKNDEQAIIVATVNNLYQTAEVEETDDLYNDDDESAPDKTSNLFYENNTFEQFRKLTSCIVIDEAHRGISKMYTRVLAGMGFNYRKKKEEERNEQKIVLIGLTATAFRGKGVDFGGELNKQTQMLYRRFSQPYFPPIYDISEKKEPFSIIDAPFEILEGETIRISAARSFDNNSVITNYSWTITQKPGQWEKNPTPLADPKPDKIIDYKFTKQGEYEISLKVTNKEKISKTSTTTINVKPKPEEAKKKTGTDKQAELYVTLIKREILSDVYHGQIKGGTVTISNKKDSDENRKEITVATKKELGRNSQRNQTIWHTINYFLTKCNKKKILVFGCNIEHARRLALVLKAKYGILADFVDSKVPPKQRIEKINQFRDGKLQVLCNTDILTTGFDVPDIDCLLVARPAKSTVLYTQMIGRGMRGPKMGGTPDVWLVDLDDQIQLSSIYRRDVIDLGWKSFSRHWKKLEDCVDKDDNQLDLPFSSRPTIHVPKKEKIRKPDMDASVSQPKEVFEEEPIVETPQEKPPQLMHKCQICGKESVGLDDLVVNLGFGKEDRKLIIDLHKKGILSQQLPSTCLICRSKSEQHIECPFVRYIEKQVYFQKNYQFVLGAYLYNQQKDDTQPTKVGAIDFLKKHNPEKKNNDFSEVFTVYLKNGLISDVDGDFNVQKILDPEGFKKICEEKYKEWFNKIKSKEIGKETEIELKGELDSHFDRLTNELILHTPTTREFQENTGEKYIDMMKKLYGDYKNYLDSKEINISEDLTLRDLLFNEYFELYHSKGQEVSINELDQHGKYDLDDYREAFGGIDAFFSIIKEITNRISSCQSIQIEKIKEDYKQLTESLGHKPHFDEIKELSKLGIEYYLKHSGTLKKFKEAIDVPSDSERVITKSKTWIWSVTPQNWEILNREGIWASKIPIEKIRQRISSGDKVVFYVIESGKFQGIFEFDGEWYPAPSPVWDDEMDDVIYQSQIKIKPVILGNVIVYDIAEKLDVFPSPDKRLINLVLKGGSGYPSNGGKPISDEDYAKISEALDKGIHREFHMDELDTKNNPILEFKKGEFYHRDIIRQKLDLGFSGGIRSSVKNNLVILFWNAPSDSVNQTDSEFAPNIYQDSFNSETGLYHYIGEGQVGDQTLDSGSGGNKRIVNAKEQGRTIHLFHQHDKKGKHEYLGQVELVDTKKERQPDVNENDREVLVFLLKPV